ncbi:MAG: hypothetical protein ACKO5E_15195 [bacterium]
MKLHDMMTMSFDTDREFPAKFHFNKTDSLETCFLISLTINQGRSIFIGHSLPQRLDYGGMMKQKTQPALPPGEIFNHELADHH